MAITKKDDDFGALPHAFVAHLVSAVPAPPLDIEILAKTQAATMQTHLIQFALQNQ
ncbi:hypothetical protein BN2475_940018 [Paraburkholderia ribeironis]|uniref:Uncharacterized protein n=1 Tax=Paraburkholderia ribeironis TaxID=1247936 RepID=A0A1N7SL45_9BURK|nr:hypothetical protein BN2475_940018 [Paraburkholderia ribeironis]